MFPYDSESYVEKDEDETMAVKVVFSGVLQDKLQILPAFLKKFAYTIGASNYEYEITAYQRVIKDDKESEKIDSPEDDDIPVKQNS